MLINAQTQAIDLQAKLFRGFGDPSRLAILEALRDGPLTVGEIVQATGLSQSNVSNHLGCLRDCGLVTSEQNWRYVTYQLSDDRVGDLLALAESRGAHHASETRHKSGGFDFREVRYGNARCLYGCARKGSTLSRPEIHGDDYEICWVLKGSLRIRLPHEVHDLATGRAIQFDAILEHTYEALADCEIVIVHMRKGKRF